MDPSLADARLLRGDGEQRLVVDRFDEAGGGRFRRSCAVGRARRVRQVRR
jgi:hypothetical protein